MYFRFIQIYYHSVARCAREYSETRKVETDTRNFIRQKKITNVWYVQLLFLGNTWSYAHKSIFIFKAHYRAIMHAKDFICVVIFIITKVVVVSNLCMCALGNALKIIYFHFKHVLASLILKVVGPLMRIRVKRTVRFSWILARR